MDKKRLYKAEEGKMFSGVCAGVAEYFSIDVSIVRILWVVAIFAGTLGLVGYIACAIILPKKSEVQ